MDTNYLPKVHVIMRKNISKSRNNKNSFKGYIEIDVVVLKSFYKVFRDFPSDI